MQTIVIKQLNPADVELLRELSVATFMETFASYNTEQNMNDYISTAFSLEKLESELNTPNSEFYFIYTDTELAGYLKLNNGDAQTEANQYSSLEIERIYVLGKFQGKRLGQALFEYALQIANQKNVTYVWLGVWEKNVRAIQFYQKNGFKAFDKHIFRLGDDEQLDIMMRLTL
jgi:diamine N-acetyltransferase